MYFVYNTKQLKVQTKKKKLNITFFITKKNSLQYLIAFYN